VGGGAVVSAAPKGSTSPPRSLRNPHFEIRNSTSVISARFPSSSSLRNSHFAIRNFIPRFPISAVWMWYSPYIYGKMFAWNVSGTRAKKPTTSRKHRVSFVEAVESFFDPNGLLLIDEKHSRAEERFYWVGKSSSGRVLTTRFTRRGTKVRIIGSAGWREFRRLYREKTKNQ